MTRRACLLVLAMLLACRGEPADGAAGEAFRPIVVGEAAPAYTVLTYAGDTVRVGPGAPQPLTLLNVWATWCIPCRKEFPVLEALHRQHAAAGLRVVGVSVDQAGDDAKIRQSAVSLGGSFPIARDPDGRIQDMFRTIGVPETFLVGRDGTLLWRHVGDVTPAREELQALLAQHLDGPLP